MGFGGERENGKKEKKLPESLPGPQLGAKHCPSPHSSPWAVGGGGYELGGPCGQAPHSCVSSCGSLSYSDGPLDVHTCVCTDVHTCCTRGGWTGAGSDQRNPLEISSRGGSRACYTKDTHHSRGQIPAPSAFTWDSDRISLCRKSGDSGARPLGLTPCPLTGPVLYWGSLCPVFHIYRRGWKHTTPQNRWQDQ